MSADGTWTLFIADLDSGGGTSGLNSWGLEASVQTICGGVGAGD